MWLDGSLYVSAPPSIWKLTDTDGDGVADRSRGVVQGEDPHRLRQRPARPLRRPRRPGLLVQGGLRPADLRPARQASRSATRAAHIFRARVDGSEVEPVMTGGMDNPVEVAFTSEGERIFTTTFLQHPGGGNRDGLIHALYGGVYGKVHDVIDGHPRTGPDVLPPLVHLGPAAPSGLMRAESDALGSRDALFTACFNLRKVARTRLTPRRGERSPIRPTISSPPTTSTSTRPTSWKTPTARSSSSTPGAGTRSVARPRNWSSPTSSARSTGSAATDAPNVDDPRGLELALAVARRSTTWPACSTTPGLRSAGGRSPGSPQRGRPPSRSIAEGPPSEPGSVEAKRNAALGGLPDRGALSPRSVNPGRPSSPPSLRSARSRSTRRASGVTENAWPVLAEALKDPSPAVRRSAAEALGRVGEPLARSPPCSTPPRTSEGLGLAALLDLRPDRDRRPEGDPGRARAPEPARQGRRPGRARPDGGRVRRRRGSGSWRTRPTRPSAAPSSGSWVATPTGMASDILLPIAQLRSNGPIALRTRRARRPARRVRQGPRRSSGCWPGPPRATTRPPGPGCSALRAMARSGPQGAGRTSGSRRCRSSWVGATTPSSARPSRPRVRSPGRRGAIVSWGSSSGGSRPTSAARPTSGSRPWPSLPVAPRPLDPGTVRVPARPARRRSPAFEPVHGRRRPRQGPGSPPTSSPRLVDALGSAGPARIPEAPRRLRQGRRGTRSASSSSTPSSRSPARSTLRVETLETPPRPLRCRS